MGTAPPRLVLIDVCALIWFRSGRPRMKTTLDLLHGIRIELADHGKISISSLAAPAADGDCAAASDFDWCVCADLISFRLPCYSSAVVVMVLPSGGILVVEVPSSDAAVVVPSAGAAAGCPRSIVVLLIAPFLIFNQISHFWNLNHPAHSDNYNYLTCSYIRHDHDI